MVCDWPQRDPVYTLWRLLAQRRPGQKICLARHARVSAVGRAKPAPGPTREPVSHTSDLVLNASGSDSSCPAHHALLSQGLSTRAWEAPLNPLFCLPELRLSAPTCSAFFSHLVAG